MGKKPNRRRSGNLGENVAVKLLKRNGYKLVERNFYSKFGEVDLIAVDGDTLVFVEVKTRWSKKYGKPEEAVTPKKLERIRKTAEYYLLLNPKRPKKLRIDVVAIEVEGNNILSSKIIKVV